MLTQEQLLERQTRLGASDFAAIMGVSPYCTAHELWLEKTGRLDASKGSDATEAGQLLEDGVLDHAEGELGELRRDVRVWRRDQPFPLAATLDAQVVATGEPVNAKTSGLMGPVYGRWGDAGTDQIPDHYLVQSLVEQFCTNSTAGIVHALLGGRGFVSYRVPYDAELMAAMLAKAEKFWVHHVEGDNEPELLTPPSIEVMKRVRRQAEKRIELEPDAEKLLDRVERLRARYRQCEKLKREAEATLLKALGDAEAADLPSGRSMTYYETTRRNKAREASESKFRVLRIQKPKNTEG